MSQRLKNLYTYLIDNRKHHLIGWYNGYVSFTSDIEKIRENLKAGAHLKDKVAFLNTSFANNERPYDDFIRKLIYEKGNGIASRGQSVLSLDNLEIFKNTEGFNSIISNLIIEIDFDSYQNFKNWWSNQGVGNNPVLVNRTLAACTTHVSTTVDEGKFNEVFRWLQKEKLIDPYTGTQGWFHENKYLIDQLRKGLEGTPEITEHWISMFVWEMYANISNPFTLNKQIVKYGAPGTGKTYTSKRDSELQFEIWKDEFASEKDFSFDEHIETVQFHPSYTYEDFLEGLRPKLDNDNKAQLTLQNGVFKEFCIKAARWEKDIFMLRSKQSDLRKWLDLTISDIEQYKDTDLNGEHWEYIFEIKNKEKKISDAIPPYFFIIDEINRAELSRVFGELMYCLEYRGVEGCIKTQYAHLNNKKVGMIKKGGSYQFFIPTNVYLIGTMNTIDRSVESFDFALRRRFKWEEVSPNTSLLHYHLLEYNEKWVDLANDLEQLNKYIAGQTLLGRDFQIGHAYLWNLPYSKDLSLSEVRKKVWEDRIFPLLQEYIRGTGQEDLLNIFAKKFRVE